MACVTVHYFSGSLESRVPVATDHDGPGRGPDPSPALWLADSEAAIEPVTVGLRRTVRVQGPSLGKTASHVGSGGHGIAFCEGQTRDVKVLFLSY